MEKQRKYLPVLSELCDRLGIVILKSILIPENRDAYKEEIDLIKHDIDLICEEKNIKLSSELVFALMTNMLINREIWLNESKARLGGDEQDKLLKFTHTLNGGRCYSKNIISKELSERVDLKVDALAAVFQTEDFIKKHGNWNIFGE